MHIFSKTAALAIFAASAPLPAMADVVYTYVNVSATGEMGVPIDPEASGDIVLTDAGFLAGGGFIQAGGGIINEANGIVSARFLGLGVPAYNMELSVSVIGDYLGVSGFISDPANDSFLFEGGGGVMPLLTTVWYGSDGSPCEGSAGPWFPGSSNSGCSFTGYFIDSNAVPVPEPGSLPLLLGALGAGVVAGGYARYGRVARP